MEAPGGNSEAYRSSNSISRRYGGLLSAANIIQAPLSTLLEYSNLLRGRSNHQETEGLIAGRFRDRLRGQLDEPVAVTSTNDGEVSIRIIGAGEQELDREGTGLAVVQGREASASQNEVVVPEGGQGDDRIDRGAGEGVSQTVNGGSDGEIGDGGGANARDSSYQRYDIQQAAKWIEQVLPFSLLLLVVFIRQHLQGNSFLIMLIILLVLKLNFGCNLIS